VALSSDRSGGAPLTIGAVADLQFREVGDEQREAVERVLAARPDVILLPGDLQQGGGDELTRTLPEVRRLLGRLRAPGGVYFVLGDVEGLGKAPAARRSSCRCSARLRSRRESSDRSAPGGCMTSAVGGAST